MVGAIQAYAVFDEKRKIELMELRLTDVQQSISEFAELNGRLPCAAPRNIPRTNPAFGREVDCKVAPVRTTSVNGLNGQRVRIGLLPARTLGISDQYMLDAYNNTFTYAVTESLTDSSTYDQADGGIDVLDNTDTSILSATAYAQYILISQGENGLGAYSYDGILVAACDTERAEGENCDNDAVFKEADLTQATAAGYYDDKIIYKNRLPVTEDKADTSCEQQDSFVTGANTCPEGWEQIVLSQSDENSIGGNLRDPPPTL